ncbi:hypothetical protein VNO77_46383 [Canavalia gladiata]|uniref:Uncharacterized protein n=1 Tax=Canavalia gladiata TaxID=3824 RepID=A0AAN9JHA0_CANGL
MKFPGPGNSQSGLIAKSSSRENSGRDNSKYGMKLTTGAEDEQLIKLDSITYAIQSLTALIPHPGLFLMFLLDLRIASPETASFQKKELIDESPTPPLTDFTGLKLSLHSMPASLSAARRSTALPSSNSAFSFSRLSDSPPGVRNRQEIRGTYLTARKWNQSRLLQDSFDLVGSGTDSTQPPIIYIKFHGCKATWNAKALPCQSRARGRLSCLTQEKPSLYRQELDKHVAYGFIL